MRSFGRGRLVRIARVLVQWSTLMAAMGCFSACDLPDPRQHEATAEKLPVASDGGGVFDVESGVDESASDLVGGGAWKVDGASPLDAEDSARLTAWPGSVDAVASSSPDHADASTSTVDAAMLLPSTAPDTRPLSDDGPDDIPIRSADLAADEPSASVIGAGVLSALDAGLDGRMERDDTHDALLRDGAADLRAESDDVRDAFGPEAESDASTSFDVAADMPVPETGKEGGPEVSDGAGELLAETFASACDRRRVDEPSGLFVDGASGADLADCGSRSYPCKTIAGGMARAAGIKTVVYLANGRYVEQVELVSGLRLEGGWAVNAGTWTPTCSSGNESVIVQGTENASYTIRAKDLAAPASLAYLTVRSKVSAAPSESLYGVMAIGTTTKLSLVDVDVAVESGGNGSDGLAGIGGNNGVPGGCLPAGDGATAGVAAANGADATQGVFGVAGYAAADGRPGEDGVEGHVGMVGSKGTCVAGGTCSSKKASQCSASQTVCGEDGRGGCPGQGGRGGQAGKGGGSSIALYIWDATVEVQGGVLRSRNGGVGGKGGRGGDPGFGTQGAAGADTPVPTCSITCTGETCHYGGCDCTSWRCANATASTPALGGSPGGGGGNGARGGDGGAGTGGSSFAAFKGGLGALNLSSDTVLDFGTPGASRGTGASGVSKPVGP